jgi:hypothetical protein
MNGMLTALYLDAERAERVRRARERRVGEPGNIRVRRSRSARRWL